MTAATSNIPAQDIDSKEIQQKTNTPVTDQ